MNATAAILAVSMGLGCGLVYLFLNREMFHEDIAEIRAEWRRLKRLWFATWDLRAAEKNLTDISFRESNGETCPQREHDEAQSWLSEATIELARARKEGRRQQDDL